MIDHATEMHELRTSKPQPRLGKKEGPIAQSMDVRMDFNFDTNGNPILVGLWLEGFGWVHSSGQGSELAFSAPVSLRESDVDDATRGGARSVSVGLLRKLKLRDYDWYRLGGTTFRVADSR